MSATLHAGVRFLEDMLGSSSGLGLGFFHHLSVAVAQWCLRIALQHPQVAADNRGGCPELVHREREQLGVGFRGG